MKLGRWKQSKGAVLIFAVGVLTVLALLAAAFTSLSKIERNVSRNYVDSVRAKLLAQSGIEEGVMQVRNAIQGAGIPALKFSIAEDLGKPWVYGRPASSTPPMPAFYHPEIPLERAIFCSFGTNPANGRANTVRLDGRQNMKVGDPIEAGYLNDEFGISGQSAGTYTGQGDFFSVQVIDSGSKIYINGPDLNTDDPNVANRNVIAALAPNVLLSLNNLSQILNAEGKIPFTDLGNKISNLRLGMARNFMRTDEIKPCLAATAQQQDRYFQALQPFITANMWMDPCTIAPSCMKHPRPNDPNLNYNPGWRSSRAASLRNEQNRRVGEKTIVDGPTREASCGSDRLVSDDAGHWAPHWNTAENTWENNLPRTGAAPLGPTRQPRAPVNINTAGLEVLEALMTGLTANVLTRNVSATEPRTYMGDMNTHTVSSADATTIANAIISYRNNLIMSRGYGFATWYDFYTFLATVGGVSNTSKQIVAANANPNSDINKFNPDRSFPTRFADVDKADLTVWTTEFSFNSNGYFEIESLGRVCGMPLASGGMPVVAEKKISTAVKVYESYRVGTQKEFVLNQATGSGTPTSIAYYPENLWDLVGSNTANWANVAAEYDGYLELPKIDLNIPNIDGQGGPPQFTASYCKDFGPDAQGSVHHGSSLVVSPNSGLPDSGGESEMFNDGLFADMTRRYPSYSNVSQYGAPYFGGVVEDYVRNGRADNKISMASGTIQMWVKPTWTASEFPTQLTGSYSNPMGEGSRTFFSVGDGHLGYTFSNTMGPQDQSVCDNRIYLMARAADTGTFVFGSEATRLANGWGWNGALQYAGPYPEKDLYYYWGQYYTNWYRMPNTAENTGVFNGLYAPATAANWSSANWAHAGNWHHIRFAWQGDRSWMFVDGNAGGTDPITAARAEPAMIASNWSLFIGSSRFRTRSTNGYVCPANCTIDDVKISTVVQNSNSLPPPRFVSTASYQGRIGPRKDILDANVQNFDYSGRIANIAWTCWTPHYTGLNSTCSVKVKGNGGAWEAAAVPVNPNDPYELTCRGFGLTSSSVLPGTEVDYEVDLSATGSNRVASPIFNDVTISVIPNAPRFLYYSIE